MKSFLNRVEVDPNSECMIWIGADDGHGDRGGYGRTRVPDEVAKAMGLKGGKTGAHRASYFVFRKPFDPELQIDHLCGVRRCVNPFHLEPVLAETNAMRANLKRWKKEWDLVKDAKFCSQCDQWGLHDYSECLLYDDDGAFSQGDF